MADVLATYDPTNPEPADPELSAALSADFTVFMHTVVADDDRAQADAWQTTCAALDKAAHESRLN